MNEPRDHVPSLTSTFKIDGGVLAQLATEVQQYWVSRNMVLIGSQFKE